MMQSRVVKQSQGRYARYSIGVPKALVLMYNLNNKYLEWEKSFHASVIKLKIRNDSIPYRFISKIFIAKSRNNTYFKTTIPKDFAEFNKLDGSVLKWESIDDKTFTLVIERNDRLTNPICFGEYGHHKQCPPCSDQDRCLRRSNEIKRKGKAPK